LLIVLKLIIIANHYCLYVEENFKRSMRTLNQVKSRWFEISLYIISEYENKVLRNVLKEREFLECDPHYCTSVEMKIIPKGGFYNINPNRLIITIDKARKYGKEIYAVNISKTPIVIYRRVAHDFKGNKIYVDPTKVYAVNVYSKGEKELCYLSTVIDIDKISMQALPLGYSPLGYPDLCISCAGYIIKDEEMGVESKLFPYSSYSVKLTREDRERNFVIDTIPFADLTNNKREFVNLLLKVKEI